MHHKTTMCGAGMEKPTLIVLLCATCWQKLCASPFNQFLISFVYLLRPCIS